jgi:hypothetical protein
MKTNIATEDPRLTVMETIANPSRRRFFQVAGGLAGAGLLLSACSKSSSNSGINLGSGDTGILNYAYALEQLEAAFYTQVISTPYTGMSTDELALLTDIRDHEVAHREFFKAALGSAAIPALSVNFTSITFSDRNSVLATAQAFEDLGVSAYNGAGRLITDPDYLLVAGKIVSVEARHAAYIRDLISFDSFASSTAVSASGLDEENSPTTVLNTASQYLYSKLNASNLPNR